jgi:xanthine dehydrogenase accessory factor
MSKAILELSQAISNKQAAVLATVVETKGASPAKVGAQILLLPGGNTVGTVGGGKLESSILEDAQSALQFGVAGLHHYRLAEEGQDAIGTLCGGEVTVFVQPYFPLPQLVIVGGGHIGRPLKVMGDAAGFDVCVVDVEPGRAEIPEMTQVSLTANSYVVLITTDHISDEAALRISLKSPAPYIGMIGSLAKCRTILGHLLADGYSAEDLERVYAPIGLDLGCTSPQEIAVAILAEVIGVR